MANERQLYRAALAPATGSILDWFLAAFPLKRDQDRRELERLRELV
jgi:hypothetical protein